MTSKQFKTYRLTPSKRRKKNWKYNFVIMIILHLYWFESFTLNVIKCLCHKFFMIFPCFVPFYSLKVTCPSYFWFIYFCSTSMHYLYHIKSHNQAFYCVACLKCSYRLAKNRSIKSLHAVHIWNLYSLSFDRFSLLWKNAFKMINCPYNQLLEIFKGKNYTGRFVLLQKT